MTADSRLDALRALLAIPCEDGYIRGTQYRYTQADRTKLALKPKSDEDRLLARWMRRAS